MKIAGWFKAHWKPVIINTVILGGFLLYCLMAEQLFENPGTSTGMAQSQDIVIPAETNDIRYGIDLFYTDNQTAVEMDGWAFIDGYDALYNQVYIVLKSDKKTRIFKAEISTQRTDVTEYFSSMQLDLTDSGFHITIPLNQIDAGRNRVGIHIEKDHLEAMQYTDRVLVKSKNGVELIQEQPTSRIADISLPSESQNVQVGIDLLKVKESGPIEIQGWAFIKGQSAENSRIYVVLKSESGSLVFSTIKQKRPDVTAYFKSLNLNLDDAGYQVTIAKDQLADGKYRVGVYIEKGEIKALQYTDKYITK